MRSVFPPIAAGSRSAIGAGPDGGGATDGAAGAGAGADGTGDFGFVSAPVMSSGAPGAASATMGARSGALVSWRAGGCAAGAIAPASADFCAGVMLGSGTGANKLVAFSGDDGLASACGGSLRGGALSG